MKFTLGEVVRDSLRDIRETAGDFFLEWKKKAADLRISMKTSFEANADYEQAKAFLDYAKRKVKKLPNRLFSGISLVLLFIIAVALFPASSPDKATTQDDSPAASQSVITARAKVEQDGKTRESGDWTVVIGMLFLAIPVCIGVKIAIGHHEKKVKMTPERFKKALARLNEQQDSERMDFLTKFFKAQGFDVDEITNRKKD